MSKELFIVADLDGTLRNLNHRLHYVENGRRDWSLFFDACDLDEPVWDVINVCAAHINSGARFEIWSGACETSFKKTSDWLNKHMKDLINWDNLNYSDDDMGQFLTHMRPEGNKTKDFLLKESWLHACDERPDMFYDDRFSVICRYRDNGMTVAQVAPYFDMVPEISGSKIKLPRKPTLVVMIGPSGAGKSYHFSIEGDYTIPNQLPPFYVSSDDIRQMQFPCSDGGFCDKKAYTREGFIATFTTAHNMIKSALGGGLDVLYDATNIKASNRKDMLKAVGADKGEYHVHYVVIDRSLDEKIKTAELENGRTSIDIIKKHHNTFQSSKKYALNGDSFDFVKVFEV